MINPAISTEITFGQELNADGEQELRERDDASAGDAIQVEIEGSN